MFVAFLTATRQGLTQDPPLQNLNHIRECFDAFLKIDRAELRLTKRISILQNTRSIDVMLQSGLRKSNLIVISHLIHCILNMERAVLVRIICYNYHNSCYIKKQVKFFRMLLYLYSPKFKAAIVPDETFVYSKQAKSCLYGKYFVVKFTSDDSQFYKDACENTKPEYRTLFSHLNNDESSSDQSSSSSSGAKFPGGSYTYENFKEFFAQNDAAFREFFNSQSFDFGNIFTSSTTTPNNSEDLFPKRGGGQYSFTKPSIPFPSYKFCYGFEQESHYSTLTDNQHLFDKEDLRFIQHSIDDTSTYTRPQLRRLLLKYHPDKNPVYTKVSAVLLSKCRNMLKKCIIM